MTRKHRHVRRPVLTATLVGVCALLAHRAMAQESRPADAPSSSLLTRARSAAIAGAPPADAGGVSGTMPALAVEPHALRGVSMFAIAPAAARIFHEHDLIEIIVRETSSAKSTQELETEKESKYNGRVTQWPDLSLDDLFNGVIKAGNTDDLPQVDLQFKKDFSGEGEYERRDDFTARLTAEIIEILPNGNLILESRTRIKTDEEETMIKVTGICRSDDVSPVNTVLSTQLHDLKIEKVNKGQIKKSSEKGIFTKALDFLFAF
ncbi:MAG: flagellar basal body L-ring protein FlgH [Planctomycetota bacterium]|jgi:flagellar L-ring protein precursor FlgH